MTRLSVSIGRRDYVRPGDLVGAIAGEFVASQEGLGYVIITAQSMFQTVRVFASIVLLGVAGTILFYAVDLAERLVCPWHVSHRIKETKALATRF